MSTTRKVGIAIAALLVLGGAYYAPSALRLYRVIHLYDEDRITENFLGMKDLLPVRMVSASGSPSALRTGSIELPRFFNYGGKRRRTSEYLDYSRSTGMIVLRGDEVLYENYWLGHSSDRQHISWSVAKSFVSALVGIALQEGKFSSIDDPIAETRALHCPIDTGF